MARTNKSFLIFRSESSWGTAGGGADYFIPVEDYGVKLNVESRQAKAACGVRQIKYNERLQGIPQGSIKTNLFGQPPSGGGDSFAKHLIDWCFATPEAEDRPSERVILVENDTGGTQRHHTGLRVSQATLSGSEGGLIELSIDVIGKEEAESAYSWTLPDDRGELLEFAFSDATFAIGGSDFPISEFQWQIQFGLKPKFSGGFSPTVLRGGQGLQTLTIKQPKNGSTYEACHRLTTTTEKTAVLTLQGLHSGIGGASNDYTKLTVTFNKLSLLTSEDELAKDDEIGNPISFLCLKPNSSTAAVTMSWGTV